MLNYQRVNAKKMKLLGWLSWLDVASRTQKIDRLQKSFTNRWRRMPRRRRNCSELPVLSWS